MDRCVKPSLPGVYAALAAGMVSVSFAAVFIKMADSPPPVVAALRMVFSSAILLPYALISGELRRGVKSLTGREAGLLFLSGAFLAAHFLTWITSLSLTGVTSSIVFVTASPLFVALYSVLVFKEKVSGSFWAGMILSSVGALVMGGGNIAAGGEEWKGDLLAVTGGVAAAGYFLVGSRLMGRLPLIAYIFPVYSAAAAILCLYAMAVGESLGGLGFRSYLYCLLLAVICQISGHSLFNWALKKLKATIVTLSILGEPVGTSVLAFFILHEKPLPAEFAGGALILAGIFTVLYFNPETVPSLSRTETEKET